VLVAKFSILGQEFLALNGGPINKFTDAVSFMINCETQEEVDYYWNALTADGGEPVQCGWLRDKFGLSWQVTPTILGELLSDPDEAKAGRVMRAMMEMVKIDIPALKRAAEGP
jgi:predicted 3-demethylubiquinone-9 3-methyltransferase (glyoxalase superfamily)